MDDADPGSGGASTAGRNGQARPVTGSTDHADTEDRRGGHRIDGDAGVAERGGRRAARGPDPAPDDTGQRVTGADAFRRARSAPEDDRPHPTDEDGGEPTGDRPQDVEPDIDKLGLADLLAGALAAYRGL